ncbi:MAG: hypothetical protein JXB03_00210 [Spirochaetales bacterium]|nr:hypothetical protein [Spirochaetales bacterium]
MSEHIETLLDFLVEAKHQTYASGRKPDQGSRVDELTFTYENDGSYTYHDGYIGSERFIGQEVILLQTKTIWGMNYYGSMLVDAIPEEFSHFLKTALSLVSRDNPFRGPNTLERGDFSYHSSWTGNLEQFRGEEYITFDKARIYELFFHGGVIS